MPHWFYNGLAWPGSCSVPKIRGKRAEKCVYSCQETDKMEKSDGLGLVLGGGVVGEIQHNASEHRGNEHHHELRAEVDRADIDLVKL